MAFPSLNGCDCNRCPAPNPARAESIIGSVVCPDFYTDLNDDQTFLIIKTYRKYFNSDGSGQIQGSINQGQLLPRGGYFIRYCYGAWRDNDKWAVTYGSSGVTFQAVILKDSINFDPSQPNPAVPLFVTPTAGVPMVEEDSLLKAQRNARCIDVGFYHYGDPSIASDYGTIGMTMSREEDLIGGNGLPDISNPIYTLYKTEPLFEAGFFQLGSPGEVYTYSFKIKNLTKGKWELDALILTTGGVTATWLENPKPITLLPLTTGEVIFRRSPFPPPGGTFAAWFTDYRAGIVGHDIRTNVQVTLRLSDGFNTPVELTWDMTPIIKIISATFIGTTTISGNVYRRYSFTVRNMQGVNSGLGAAPVWNLSATVLLTSDIIAASPNPSGVAQWNYPTITVSFVVALRFAPGVNTALATIIFNDGFDMPPQSIIVG